MTGIIGWSIFGIVFMVLVVIVAITPEPYPNDPERFPKFGWVVFLIIPVILAISIVVSACIFGPEYVFGP